MLGQRRADAGVLRLSVRVGQHRHQRRDRRLARLAKPHHRLGLNVRRRVLELPDQRRDVLGRLRCCV